MTPQKTDRREGNIALHGLIWAVVGAVICWGGYVTRQLAGIDVRLEWIQSRITILETPTPRPATPTTTPPTATARTP